METSEEKNEAGKGGGDVEEPKEESTAQEDKEKENNDEKLDDEEDNGEDKLGKEEKREENGENKLGNKEKSEDKGDNELGKEEKREEKGENKLGKEENREQKEDDKGEKEKKEEEIVEEFSSSEDDEQYTPDELLLLHSRHGKKEKVKKLLEHAQEAGKATLNVNCKGCHKANLGWSPIHLAAYFGHTEIVKMLLQHNADVNAVNGVGDTALHRAAYTGREDMVTLLLKNNADVNLYNAEGNKAKSIARSDHIKSLIEAAEKTEYKKHGDGFLKAAAEGDTETLKAQLKSSSFINIHTTDQFGNTALHLSSYRGHKEAAVLLLQNGIDTTLKNAKGQLALDMSQDGQMRQLLDVKPIRELMKMPQRYEGQLIKKTRFFGWKPFYVVLERGVVNLYKSRLDGATGARRKACKHLERAKIESKAGSGHVFLVRFSDGSLYYLAVEPNENANVNRQKWETCLREHMAYSTSLHEGSGVSDDDEFEDLMPLGSMQDALQTAGAHQQVLEKQVASITHAVQELSEEKVSGSRPVQYLQVRQKMSHVVDTSKEMYASLAHCVTVFTQQEQIRQQLLQQEIERGRVLQDAIKALAQEHHELQTSLKRRRYSASRGASRGASPAEDAAATGDNMADDDDNSEDEFYECNEDEVVSSFKQAALLLDNNGQMDNNEEENNPALNNHNNSVELEPDRPSRWGGRCRLPVPMISRNDFSVWSILKQCIGKELSKITMPVVFNEPLSFLQRVVEYMEYASLLQKAADCDDPIERMEYVSAFAVSSSASNWDRVGKPFNPLLGETYELDREDLGFRVLCEQVSHHPPVSAFHVESPGYTFQGAIHPKLKFWGKSVEVTPRGVVTLHLLNHQEMYTWQNVNCQVHNVMTANERLWIEHAKSGYSSVRGDGGGRDIATLQPLPPPSQSIRYAFGAVINMIPREAVGRNKKQTQDMFPNFKYGESYTWQMVNCCVHNIIVGTLWIEHYGVMEIMNHKTKHKAVLNFKPSGWFGKDLHKVEGYIFDSNKKKLRAIYGKWIEALYSYDVSTYESYTKSSTKRDSSSDETNDSKGTENIPHRGSSCNLSLPGQKQLWQADPKPSDSSKYYSFTHFAMMLNEVRGEMNLPPTDCRLRPDIRKLEQGDLDGAAEEKHRLEEKQRATRKERKKTKAEWSPSYFINNTNPQTGKEDWLYNGRYWEKDWSHSDDIF